MAQACPGLARARRGRGTRPRDRSPCSSPDGRRPPVESRPPDHAQQGGGTAERGRPARVLRAADQAARARRLVHLAHLRVRPLRRGARRRVGHADRRRRRVASAMRLRRLGGGAGGRLLRVPLPGVSRRGVAWRSGAASRYAEHVVCKYTPELKKRHSRESC